MEKEIRITNELDEITALAIFVEEFCSDLSLPAETTMHINLALEEAAYDDITIPIEESDIGGLCIFLIRSIMNEVSYQRLDGENRLTMKKYIELG